MTGQEKRKIKKRIKAYRILSYVAMVVCIVSIIIVASIRIHTGEALPASTAIPVVLSTFGSVFFMAIFLILAGAEIQKLTFYKRQIEFYRARVVCAKVIDLLAKGELENAINEWGKCKDVPEKDLNDNIFGLAVMAHLLSKDKDHQKKGAEKISYLKRLYSPDKILF